MESQKPPGISPGRLLALADGIFAIAMTLLAFEIRLPAGIHGADELVAAVAHLGPKLGSFALSFITLGFAWIGHHNQYAFIRRVDRQFLWINIFFFLPIVLVPFCAAVLGELPFEWLAVALYAGNLTVAALLLWMHWAYATGRGRLTDGELAREVVAATRRRIVAAPVAYAGAVVAAAVHPVLGLAICVLVPVSFMLPGRVDRALRG